MEGLTKEQVDKLFADNSTILVKFIKKDGSLRSMLCTTKLQLVPEKYHPKGEKPPNPEIKNVWSVNDAGWKRFRYDSLVSVPEVVS